MEGGTPLEGESPTSGQTAKNDFKKQEIELGKQEMELSFLHKDF